MNLNSFFGDLILTSSKELLFWILYWALFMFFICRILKCYYLIYFLYLSKFSIVWYFMGSRYLWGENNSGSPFLSFLYLFIARSNCLWGESTSFYIAIRITHVLTRVTYSALSFIKTSELLIPTQLCKVELIYRIFVCILIS